MNKKQYFLKLEKLTKELNDNLDEIKEGNKFIGFLSQEKGQQRSLIKREIDKVILLKNEANIIMKEFSIMYESLHLIWDEFWKVTDEDEFEENELVYIQLKASDGAFAETQEYKNLVAYRDREVEEAEASGHDFEFEEHYEACQRFEEWKRKESGFRIGVKIDKDQ